MLDFQILHASEPGPNTNIRFFYSHFLSVGMRHAAKAWPSAFCLLRAAGGHHLFHHDLQFHSIFSTSTDSLGQAFQAVHLHSQIQSITSLLPASASETFSSLKNYWYIKTTLLREQRDSERCCLLQHPMALVGYQ
jgi:hypothetical protein